MAEQAAEVIPGNESEEWVDVRPTAHEVDQAVDGHVACTLSLSSPDDRSLAPTNAAFLLRLRTSAHVGLARPQSIQARLDYS
jgi:hypothetical protein